MLLVAVDDDVVVVESVAVAGVAVVVVALKGGVNIGGNVWLIPRLETTNDCNQPLILLDLRDSYLFAKPGADVLSCSKPC